MLLEDLRVDEAALNSKLLQNLFFETLNVNIQVSDDNGTLKVGEAKYENASGGKISDAAIRDTGKLLKELADDFDKKLKDGMTKMGWAIPAPADEKEE